MTSSCSRLWAALIVSALLHTALLAARMPAATLPKQERLNVKLAVPEVAPTPQEPPPPPDPEVFEKNTIAPETPAEPPKPKPPSTPASGKPARLKANDEQRALRKLSEHILYPQAAVDANHEGTVHLLLKLDANGLILDVDIAASSGHAELDHAAVASALRAGRLNAGGRTDIILPITFRLQ